MEEARHKQYILYDIIYSKFKQQAKLDYRVRSPNEEIFEVEAGSGLHLVKVIKKLLGC